jgi:hypothetical protein
VQGSSQEDLERELQRLKTERRKVELRRKIEEEKEDLKKLQHAPKANSLATEGTIVALGPFKLSIMSLSFSPAFSLFSRPLAIIN